MPVEASYYRGFEQGDFPFVIGGTDPTWTTENAIDSTLVWEKTNEKANTGVFSIKSPVLDNDAATPGQANATLTTIDLGPGTLFFSILSEVKLPMGALGWFVDGEFRGGAAEGMTAFEEQSIAVLPGPHVYSFVYAYNPGAIPAVALPPDNLPPNQSGTVYIDDVYFIPLAVV